MIGTTQFTVTVTANGDLIGLFPMPTVHVLALGEHDDRGQGLERHMLSKVVRRRLRIRRLDEAAPSSSSRR